MLILVAGVELELQIESLEDLDESSYETQSCWIHHEIL